MASGGELIVTLRHTWISTESITVQKNEFYLEPLKDYRVDLQGNSIRLLAPLAEGDTILVDYVYAPFSLLRSYSRRSLADLKPWVPLSDRGRSNLDSSRSDAVEQNWTSLRRAGSLIRSIQIGTNQDLSFESALSLQVEGKVGSNVEIVAALSDQNLPIQPEGTTESIRELDKVFVTAKSEHFKATIGDYELELAGGRYDAYSRKLTGLTLGAIHESASAQVSAAVGRGEYASNRFSGEESVQGPYSLTGRNGESHIVILAGTETVWLDGLQLRRGSDNDYIIDYSAGQITFTSRRLITSDSRIFVEFEYANEDYERQFWASRATAHSRKLNSNVFATFITERDDRNRPLGFALDSLDRKALAFAGDSAGLAITESADSVGPNLGDYVRRDTLIESQEYSYFVYVFPSPQGVPQGDWQVFFDDFGNGGGEYVAEADSLGRTYYRFVGIGVGRYKAARRLPLPSSKDLAAIRVAHGRDVGFNGSAEIALSNHDRNSFSGLNDSDNNGAAATVQLGYNAPELDLYKFKLRNFVANLEGNIRDKSYSDLSRSDEVEFDRMWAGSLARQEDEQNAQLSVGVSPIRSFNIGGSVGALARGEAFNSTRISTNATFQPMRSTSLYAEHLSIISDDSTDERHTDWVRQRMEGRTAWRGFLPRATLNRERQLRDSRSAESGFRFNDISFGSAYKLPSDIEIEAEAGFRQDDTRSSGSIFSKVSESVGWAGEVRWMPNETGRGSVRWSHRDRNYENPDSMSVSSDAGRFELFVSPRNRVLEFNATYDALKSRTEQQLQLFVPVTPGSGSYSLVNGTYVPDDQGDFILVSRNTGDFSPSSEIRASSQIWIRPDETKGEGNPIWSRLSFETEATVEEQTRDAITIGLLLLDRRKLRTPSTIDGRFSLRQDVHYNRLSRKWSLRLRVQNSGSQVSRYTNGSQLTTGNTGTLRVRYVISSAFRGETEISCDLERQIYQGLAAESSDIRRFRVQEDVVWSSASPWEAGLKIVGVESADEKSRTQASIRTLAPRISYTKYQRGRADGEFQWTHVGSNRSRLSQSIGEGSNRGENFRWSFRVTYSFSANFSGSIEYSGRRDAGEDIINVGRVEARANF